MAPRKKSRARPVTARTKTKPEPEMKATITVGSMADLPAEIREHMLMELLTLQNGADRVVLPSPRDARVAGAMAGAETRGQALVGRATQIITELHGTVAAIENSVRAIGGAWPWPEPPAAGKADATGEPDNFHGMLGLRLDQLQSIVRHAGIVAERLRDIA